MDNTIKITELAINNDQYFVELPEHYSEEYVKDKIDKNIYQIIDDNLIITGLDKLKITKYNKITMDYISDKLSAKLELLFDYVKEKEWFKIGKLSEYDELKEKYSPFKYQYGIVYNSTYPLPIMITSWNKGLRFTFMFNYPQGDNVNMIFGNTIFKKETNDSKNLNGALHEYVQINNGIYNKHGSNGVFDVDLYVRRY